MTMMTWRTEKAITWLLLLFILEGKKEFDSHEKIERWKMC